MIGTHIGNYRIVRELGAGAMGEVYYAEHTVMGRRAAIKIIREELSDNAEMVERFVNEARLVNRIGHPNIVEITDFGQFGSSYYIMMELLEGETLEQRLERATLLSEAGVQGIGVQIASALGAAHGLGVVHRDLKPENIFLLQREDRPDFVKVLDFGIAKLMGLPSPNAGTVPGTLLGTPHYMSPEQCYGANTLDHRSDVYSLGVILYRMLTGTLPFDSDTLLGVLYAHANTPPQPPRELRPEISTHMQAVVLKALAKAPDERFQDMLSFRAALEGQPLPQTLTQTHAALARTAVIAHEIAGRAPEPAPLAEQAVARAGADAFQGQRVGSRLARILVDRINKDRLVLPNLPLAARECLELLDDPDGALIKVAAAIGRDPIIAPQIMRRAKSALLGGRSPITTIEQAVTRLGATHLRSILVDLCARRLFESKDPNIRRATLGLWEHSVAVAVLSRAIALRRRDVDPESAYLAGLLHDVGKPVAAALLIEAERAADAQSEVWLGKDVWLEVIEECHREVGVALARAWGLQDDLIIAIARSARYSSGGAGTTASVVCFANALVKREGIYTGTVDLDAVDALIREGMQLFGIEPAILVTLLAVLRDPKGKGAASGG